MSKSDTRFAWLEKISPETVAKLAEHRVVEVERFNTYAGEFRVTLAMAGKTRHLTFDEAAQLYEDLGDAIRAYENAERDEE